MAQDNQGRFFEGASPSGQSFLLYKFQRLLNQSCFHMQSPGSFPILFLYMNRNQRLPGIWGKLFIWQIAHEINNKKKLTPEETYNSGNKMEKHILLSYRKGFFFF